ncbi:MAG: hypothetical protein H7196_01885, partial [candidate division SR1 bacterium]|nr:hypothetical protein [candidate division SR1 bacterium]
TAGNNPTTIAIDPAGNIYTANYGSNNVSKITPAGVSSIISISVGTSYGFAVDTIGNVYITSGSNDRVTKISPAGESSTIPITIFSINGSVSDIAVDTSGNIYIVNSGSNNITKLSPNFAGIKALGGDYNEASTFTDNTVTIANISTTLQLSVLLSGAKDIIGMRSDLRAANLIPASQPYNTPAFGYAGTETIPGGIDAIPSNFVDWILVEIKTPNGVSELKKAVLLDNKGRAHDAATPTVDRIDLGTNVTAGALYNVIIRHFNHIAISTNTPITITTDNSGNNTLDFTINNNVKADNQQLTYTIPAGQIGAGNYYGLKQGNTNGDDVIDSIDRAQVRIAPEASIYSPSDLNLDGVIDGIDKTTVRTAIEVGEVIN